MSKGRTCSCAWLTTHTECTYTRHKETVLFIALAYRHMLVDVHVWQYCAVV